MVFIALSVLQIQENNEYRLVNSRVNSIVLKCLETLVKHEPRVYEMTSQSTIDNLPYRLIFVLDKSRPKKLHSRKEPLKSSKIPKFG